MNTKSYLEVEKILSLYKAKEAIINKISPQICSTIDLEKFLEAVVKEIGKMMDVDRCNLMVYKYFGALKINFEYLKEKDLPSSLNEEIPVNRGFLLSSNYKYQPYVLNNIETENVHPMVKILCERFKTKSLLIVPINFRDELLAVIGLHHSKTNHNWNEEEISFIESLANLIAIAFKYTKMFEEKEKEVEISKMLLSLINDLYSSKDIDATMKKLLDNLNEIFNSDIGCFGTFSKREEKIIFNIVRQREFSLNSLTLPEEINLREKPTVVENLKKGKNILIHSENSNNFEEKTFLNNLSCSSLNITPIIMSGELYGVIILIWYDGHKIILEPQNNIIHSVIKQISIYFEKHRLSNEIKKLQNELKEIKFQKSIAGNRQFYRDLLQKGAKALEKNNFLIIEGKEGVGKEFFGKLLHNFTEDGSPFVIVDSKEEDILEKIFGYEVIENKHTIKHIPGIIETNSNSTIFFKNGEFLQGKVLLHLLNVLKTKEFTFAFSGKKIRVDNKFLISVRDDDSEIINFFGKEVEKIYIPTLEERKDEIPEFIKYFVSEYSETLKKEIKEIKEEYVNYLTNKKFERNIDELKEIIKNSVEKSKNGVLNIYTIDEDMTTDEDITISIKVGTPLKEIEKEIIKKFLSHFKNDKTKTAKALNIGKKTIYRKIKE